MYIYVLKMHALIYICRVSHNKTFSETPTILLEGIKNVNNEITRKIAPSNPNWLEFLNISRDLESQDRKGIWNRQVGHDK